MTDDPEDEPPVRGETGSDAAVPEPQPAGDAELTALHPNHLTVLRIRTALASLPFILGAWVIENLQIAPPAVIIVPVALIALFAILRLPTRRHHARGYRLDSQSLRVVRGIWFRVDTVVPFNRVQHIDVFQGPLERLFGIATLVLHTAGTHGASVTLPGLGEELARAMRDSIREKIRQENL